MGADPKSPDRGTNQTEPKSAEKDKGGEQSGDHGEGNQDCEAEAVEETSENERAKPVLSLRSRT